MADGLRIAAFSIDCLSTNLIIFTHWMSGAAPNELTPIELDQRRQLLTGEIRTHATGARSETRHPIRVRHAVECGHALSQLKHALRHGDWDRWVEEQCGLSRATAHRYMRLASRADRLTPYMTIREAYIAAGVIKPTQPHAEPPPEPLNLK
jgi:hypothetical protein